MCFGNKPKVAAVDPAAERAKAAAEAAAAANEARAVETRQARASKGLLSSDEVAANSVLATVAKKRKTAGGSVLGSAAYGD